MGYLIEEWGDGSWRGVHSYRALTLTHAAEILSEADREQGPRPRRVVDETGALIFSGRHCSRNTPVNDTKPVWIVMSLDKPGPCERGERPYTQQSSKAIARDEARRLSRECAGGRFGVLIPPEVMAEALTATGDYRVLRRLTPRTVHHRVREVNVVTYRACLLCEKPFKPDRQRSKFCSIRCAKLHHYANNSPSAESVLLSRRNVDDVTGCWNWTGDRAGRPPMLYGRVKYRGKAHRTHRLSYGTFKGDIPLGQMVCHRCDNPLCFNPAHLFLGTNAENLADMRAKGRQPRGSTHGSHKLSDMQVGEIRALAVSGIKRAEIARRYNVNWTTVALIVAGKRRVA